METIDSDDGGTERPTERVVGASEGDVLVSASTPRRRYHRRRADGTPPCRSNGASNPGNWETWSVEQAVAWAEPCQLPRCYGTCYE